MHSSTYKAQGRFTERPLDDIDDTSILNVRVDSVDLERAAATLDAARSSNRGLRCLLYQGPGSFRIHLAPPSQLPRVPRTAVVRRKIESKFDDPGQTNPARNVPPRHQPWQPALVLSRARSSDNGIRDKSTDRSRASVVSGSTLVGKPSLSLSAYETGLISIKSDFASSLQ